jgi:hypothetical protein
MLEARHPVRLGEDELAPVHHADDAARSVRAVVLGHEGVDSCLIVLVARRVLGEGGCAEERAAQKSRYRYDG